MICYICAGKAVNAVQVDGHKFAYCDLHNADVQLGAIQFQQTGRLNRLILAKHEHAMKKGSASVEFEKNRRIVEHLQDDDSSVTEQAI